MVRVPLTADEIRRGQEVGALLREARGERTLLDVAVGAGISPETLRKIETGRIPTPSFTTVALLAAEVGLSLDAIWRRVEFDPGAADPTVADPMEADPMEVDPMAADPTVVDLGRVS